jgi:hypothetical protein
MNSTKSFVLYQHKMVLGGRVLWSHYPGFLLLPIVIYILYHYKAFLHDRLIANTDENRVFMLLNIICHILVQFAHHRKLRQKPFHAKYRS